jgi:DNA-binding transcriptional regulator YhcF (GntR family)
MVRQKYQEIKNDALRTVKSEEPISTAELAKILKVNWATAQRSLGELEREGKIKGKSVSGRNIWFVSRK